MPRFIAGSHKRSNTGGWWQWWTLCLWGNVGGTCSLCSSSKLKHDFFCVIVFWVQTKSNLSWAQFQKPQIYKQKNHCSTGRSHPNSLVCLSFTSYSVVIFNFLSFFLGLTPSQKKSLVGLSSAYYWHLNFAINRWPSMENV